MGRRRRVVDDVLDWDNGRSHAHVRIWEPAEDTAEPSVVVIGNLDDSRGQSATNGFEDVAMLVAARYLGPAGLQAQYYDHWSRSGGGEASFHHVTFSVTAPTGERPGRGRGVDRSTAQALGGVLSDPSWRATTVEEIERLVGETVEVYSAGTYTAAMVRAVQHAGDDGLDAVWDPDNALAAARASGWLHVAGEDGCPAALQSVRKPAMSLLAVHAVRGRERAARDLAWQDPDAPVRLHLPDLPRAADLRRAAERGRRAVEHEQAWAVVGAARAMLADLDANESRLLVPARGGGLTRLAWWEAGTPEPRDERDGMSGPIVLAEDLLGTERDDRPLSEPELARAVERAAVRFLEEECRAVDVWDVPAVRPAGPFPATTPTARLYLDSVTWRAVGAADRDREARLTLLFEEKSHRQVRRRRGSPSCGFDTAGRLVVKSADGRSFCLEWPVGAGDYLERVGGGLLDAVVRADADRKTGAQPVWVELPDGPVVPLPSRAAWSSAHEYTWGYSGTGPANLTAAICDLALLAHHAPEQVDPEDLAEAVHDLVRSGRTPAWRVRDLLTAAGVAIP
jgi:hypothetical protein